MALSKAFLQEKGGGKLIHEMGVLRDELVRRGVPVTLFTEKRVQRRQVPFDRECLVAGEMPSVLAAMKVLGIPEPEPDDYPECLRDVLRRRVWKSTLRDVESAMFDDARASIFVKPAERRKRFTGFVAESCGDLARVQGASRRDPVWCSEVVSWKSEWRYYVIADRIAGADHYLGDASVRPDVALVEDAIRRLRVVGRAHAAYAIDFGVLVSGETALVEMNDGFSIGIYGLDPAIYAEFTIARWEELLRSAVAAN